MFNKLRAKFWDDWYHYIIPKLIDYANIVEANQLPRIAKDLRDLTDYMDELQKYLKRTGKS